MSDKARLCLKYAFCQRKNGAVTEFVHKRKASWLGLWYWFWKLGMAPPWLDERVLLGEIRVPRYGKIDFGSSKGAASLIDSMMSKGLVRGTPVDFFDPLKTILELTNLGKDIRDILCSSPRLEHLKHISAEMKQRPVFKLKVHWWNWLPESDSWSSGDKILKYEYCPCGSAKKYAECCDESK